MKEKILKILKITVIVIASLLIINYGIFLYGVFKNNLKFSSVSALKRTNFSVENLMNYDYREPSGLNYKNKKSIIIFGCGYAEGVDLNDNQTFEKKLSDYLKVPVYNRGIGAGFIQHAILQVQSGKIDDIIKNSSTVIYIIANKIDFIRLKTYPSNLFDPQFVYSKELYPVLQDKDDNLVFINSKFPSVSGNIFSRLITKVFYKNFYEKIYSDLEELTIIHLEKLNEELKKLNPNIKLVVLMYCDLYKDMNKLNNDLEREGITVLYVTSLSKLAQDELLSDEYQTKKYKHPNEKVWNLLTPAIAKELKKL